MSMGVRQSGDLWTIDQALRKQFSSPRPIIVIEDLVDIASHSDGYAVAARGLLTTDGKLHDTIIAHTTIGVDSPDFYRIPILTVKYNSNEDVFAAVQDNGVIPGDRFFVNGGEEPLLVDAVGNFLEINPYLSTNFTSLRIVRGAQQKARDAAANFDTFSRSYL